MLFLMVCLAYPHALEPETKPQGHHVCCFLSLCVENIYHVVKYPFSYTLNVVQAYSDIVLCRRLDNL